MNRLLISTSFLGLSLLTCALLPVLDPFVACGMSVVIATSAAVYASYQADSLLFFLRQALLYLAGIVPAFLVIQSEGYSKIAYVGERYQSIPVETKVLAVSALAITANAAGWLLAQLLSKKRKSAPPTYQPLFQKTHNSLWFYSFLGLSAFCAYFVGRSLGPFVWESAYATVVTPLPFNLGSLPLIAVLLLCCSYAAMRLSPDPRDTLAKQTLWAFGAIYILFFCMIARGMRTESVSAIFALLGIELFIRRHRFRPLPFLLIGAGTYCLVLGWGSYRALAAENVSFIDAMQMAFSQLGKNQTPTGPHYHLGTIGDIASTLSTLIGATEYRNQPYLLGSGYFDYLLRTFPEYLTPGRPRDLAWIFAQIDETAAGGIFELAEAYLNFGVLGCLFVPFIIGYGLSVIESWCLRSRTLIPSILFAAMFLSIFRGTLYQTFSLYRSFVLGAFLCLGIAFVEFLLNHFSHLIPIFKPRKPAR